MPNHFLTVGICARDYKRLEAQGKDDYDDITALNGKNLCEIVNKMPNELEGIVATNPPSRYRNKLTGEWSKDCNGPMGDDRKDFEQVFLTAEEQDALLKKYNGTNWFDWQSGVWGTKWGTYNTKAHELGGDGSPVMIEFESAWGPPNAETMQKIDAYLRETHCLKNIKWIGHDPYDNSILEIDMAEPTVASAI